MGKDPHLSICISDIFLLPWLSVCWSVMLKIAKRTPLSCYVYSIQEIDRLKIVEKVLVCQHKVPDGPLQISTVCYWFLFFRASPRSSLRSDQKNGRCSTTVWTWYVQQASTCDPTRNVRASCVVQNATRNHKRFWRLVSSEMSMAERCDTKPLLSLTWLSPPFPNESFTRKQVCRYRLKRKSKKKE